MKQLLQAALRELASLQTCVADLRSEDYQQTCQRGIRGFFLEPEQCDPLPPIRNWAAALQAAASQGERLGRVPASDFIQEGKLWKHRHNRGAASTLRGRF